MSTTRPSFAPWPRRPHEPVAAHPPRMADLPLDQPDRALLISAYFGYSITPPDAIPLGRRARRRRQFAAHRDADRAASSSRVSALLSCGGCGACRWSSTSPSRWSSTSSSSSAACCSTPSRYLADRARSPRPSTRLSAPRSSSPSPCRCSANVIVRDGQAAGLRHAQEPADRPLRPAQARSRRAFLLIDMKDSTGLAERLGPIRFHELLNDFFRDIADAALECERGDPQVRGRRGDPDLARRPRARPTAIAWPVRSSPATSSPPTARRYRGRFGVVPEFRAALHCGEIVAGEIGDVRREIAYVGDTLNVAARLLDAAKTTGPRRAGLGRPAGTGDPAGRHRAPSPCRRLRCAAARRRLAIAALRPDRRRTLTRSSRLPKMPLGRKMMNSTSRTP